ncbi:retrovirus-related pol polyprotein from transposon TNT 1-94 [Tanacetum coccineum]
MTIVIWSRATIAAGPRLSHLNFKSINKLAKQNKVLGLHSLVYSKDKPCPACEKDLFGPVSPISINHEKYTLVIVDEYSRIVENQNDVKVKQIRTDNGTEFRNTKLEIFCDEKGISLNLSSLYTPKQNDVPEKKNKTLIEAARTMLSNQYQASPKESHLTTVKRIFRYLKGTSSLGLWYPECSGFDLKVYSDSNYAGGNMDRKSTSCACQILGGKLVCWSAKKQQSVAMSSAETEYVTGCCANILWMKSQLSHYKMVAIFCDNTSAIAISNNPVLHSRTKHIDIRYNFIRDHIL